MANGKKMSEYTPFSELSSEEKATYLGNAAVTTFGAKEDAGANINVNIPLSTLVPSATDLAGDGLTVNAGKLDVSNKVPAPTASTDRGKVLSVATDSDNIVWSTPAVTAISPKNGAITVINTANDVASGGYFFDVNTDASLATVDVSVDNTTVRKLKVANPVPPTTDASDGAVLTYKDSDGIVWAPAQGGGGGGLPDPSDLVGINTGSGTGFASFVPYCTVTCDAANKVISVGQIKWGYKWHASGSSPVDGDMP